ncbi:MAG: ABC transporter permease subunit [Pirellulaceae bacterium]|nr:ABC transporter permease subunit [Pirellulaceae bacterium]
MNASITTAPPTNSPPATGRRGPRLRQPISVGAAVGWATLSVVVFFAVWWWLTAGAGEARIMSPTVLPSPRETFSEFPSLWFDSALTRNLFVTLRRVTLGFALAMLVGVPLGILAGCYSWIRALLAPVVIFGRNIPLAALLPLTFFFFGIGEWQKIMFIFVACVAFVIADVTVAISEISSRYLDTAYTLGANSWQAIIKVLVPLALPAILDSARLLFGLAFGYIMLAELIRFGEDAGGLGNLILVAQRRGPREHIYLIILIIPVVALAIDRVLYLLQVQLCPFRYGGAGWLNRGLRMVLHAWDDLKSRILAPKPPFDQLLTAPASTPATPAEPPP